MAVAGTLKGVLTLDQTQYVAGLKDASKQIGKFNADSNKASHHSKDFEAHLLTSRASISVFASVTGVAAGELHHFAHAMELLPGPIGLGVVAFLLFKSALETASEAAKKHAEQVAEDTRAQAEFYKILKKTNEELGLTPKSSRISSALGEEMNLAEKRIAQLAARKREMEKSGRPYDASGALKFSKADQAEINRLQELVSSDRQRIAALNDDKFVDFKKSMKRVHSEEFTQKYNADSNDPIKNMQDENKLLEEKANLIKDMLRMSLNDKERYEELDSQLESIMLKQKDITDEIKKQGREITDSVNPAAKFKQEVESLQELLAAGAIDQGTYDKKVMQDRKKMFQEQMSLSGSGGTPHFASAASISQAIVDHMKHSGQDIAKQHLAVAQKTLDAIITLAGAQQAQKQMTSIAGI